MNEPKPLKLMELLKILLGYRIRGLSWMHAPTETNPLARKLKIDYDDPKYKKLKTLTIHPVCMDVLVGDLIDEPPPSKGITIIDDPMDPSGVEEEKILGFNPSTGVFTTNKGEYQYGGESWTSVNFKDLGAKRKKWEEEVVIPAFKKFAKEHGIEVSNIKISWDDGVEDESTAPGRQSGTQNPDSDDRQQDGLGSDSTEMG